MAPHVPALVATALDCLAALVEKSEAVPEPEEIGLMAVVAILSWDQAVEAEGEEGAGDSGLVGGGCPDGGMLVDTSLPPWFLAAELGSMLPDQVLC